MFHLNSLNDHGLFDLQSNCWFTAYFHPPSLFTVEKAGLCPSFEQAVGPADENKSTPKNIHASHELPFSLTPCEGSGFADRVQVPP